MFDFYVLLRIQYEFMKFADHCILFFLFYTTAQLFSNCGCKFKNHKIYIRLKKKAVCTGNPTRAETSIINIHDFKQYFLQILLHPQCIHGKSIILASYEDIHFIGSVMHPHCIHSFFSPFLVSSCLFVFICFSFSHSHFCQEGVIDCLPLFKRSQH